MPNAKLFASILSPRNLTAVFLLPSLVLFRQPTTKPTIKSYFKKNRKENGVGLLESETKKNSLTQPYSFKIPKLLPTLKKVPLRRNRKRKRGREIARKEFFREGDAKSRETLLPTSFVLFVADRARW